MVVTVVMVMTMAVVMVKVVVLMIMMLRQLPPKRTHTVVSQPWQPENVGRPSQPAGVGQSTRAVGGGTAKNRTEAAGIGDHDLGPLSTRRVQRFRS